MMEEQVDCAICQKVLFRTDGYEELISMFYYYFLEPSKDKTSFDLKSICRGDYEKARALGWKELERIKRNEME